MPMLRCYWKWFHVISTRGNLYCVTKCAFWTSCLYCWGYYPVSLLWASYMPCLKMLVDWPGFHSNKGLRFSVILSSHSDSFQDWMSNIQAITWMLTKITATSFCYRSPGWPFWLITFFVRFWLLVYNHKWRSQIYIHIFLHSCDVYSNCHQSWWSLVWKADILQLNYEWHSAMESHEQSTMKLRWPLSALWLLSTRLQVATCMHTFLRTAKKSFLILQNIF